MSSKGQDGQKEALFSLISCLRLRDVRQTAIESRRLGDPTPKSNIGIEWKQAFGKDDPARNTAESSILFRVRYEFNVKADDSIVFRHVAEYLVLFDLADADAFWSLWADAELQEQFRDRQIRRTLWPFLRQQVLEGMLRLGLPPVTLPWLL